MTVQPLSGLGPNSDVPDVPEAALSSPLGSPAQAAGSFGRVLEGVLGAATEALGRADGAERAFERGRGGLQEMMLERAQADIALSLASVAASRAAQSLTTIFGMQV